MQIMYRFFYIDISTIVLFYEAPTSLLKWNRDLLTLFIKNEIPPSSE